MSHLGTGTHVTGSLGSGGRTDGDSGDGRYKGPTATPFLVVASAPGDIGGRPIPVDQAVTNQGITVAIASGLEWKHFQLQLSCLVTNLGVVGCAAGVAEFYIGRPFSIWNSGHETLTPAQVKSSAVRIGYAPFQAPPGKTVTVVCKNLWKAGSSWGAQAGILVQVYDLFTDHMTSPFDAVNDRHVARNDQVLSPLVSITHL